jgi:hypothetical protein
VNPFPHLANAGKPRYDPDARASIKGRGRSLLSRGRIMAIVGTWKLTLETPFGVQTPSLRIDADGTGGLISPIGEAPLTDLNVTDDTAEFSANVPTPMGNFAIGFSVKASGDALAGTFTSPLGATDFTGLREA